MKSKIQNNAEKSFLNTDPGLYLGLIDDIVLEIDANNVLRFVDPKVIKANGFTSEEMIGREIFDFVAEWSRECLRAALANTHSMKDSSNRLLTTNIRKDGTFFPAASSFTPIWSPDGRLMGHLIVGRDISSDLDIQAKILEKHLMYQAVVETQTELICRHGSSGKITFANQAFCSYFNQDTGKCINSSFFNYLPYKEREVVQSKLLALNPSHPQIILEHEEINKDGETEWIQWIHRALFHKDGSFIEFQSSGRNITNIKNAEQRITMFKTMADAANYGIAIADLQGKLVYANQQFALMHGNKAKKKKYSIKDFHSTEQMPHIKGIIEKLLSEESFNALEIKHRSADGMVMPMLMNGVLIRNADGQPIYVAVTAIDISEKKNTEQLIYQKNQDLKEKNVQLQEMNSALKVLLEQRVKDKEEIETSIISNLRELILPSLQAIRNIGLSQEQILTLNLLEHNLLKLVSPYVSQMKNRYPWLSNKEMQVVALIQDGLGTKEIANLMGISQAAINLHRYNIRQKLGLNKSKISLTDFLLSQNVRST